MMNKGGLKRKSKAASEIPSSSLADMAFLLLIFFMVTTTFRKEEERDVVFPEAEATEKLEQPRKDILHVYVEADGSIYINDQLYATEQVSNVIAPMYAENTAMVVMLRSDRDVSYVQIDQILEELQEAGAVRVSFYTNLEQRMTRERR
ncbi:MAG TPA: biopolymer transporter ExbD [Candidatus Synoicihabitans sp.]|nr:biopolymer transporter ExbD [Candidatus Synoicihabitans sp.]